MSVSVLIIGASVLVIVVVNVIFLRKVGQKKQDSSEEANFLQQRIDSRFDSVTKLILDELKENRQSVHKSSLAVHQQVEHFTRGLTQLEENVKGVHQSLRDVVSFQHIFKSPKLRGQWGETSLEAVLAGYFSKNIYSIQHYFKSGEAVDAVLRLPDGSILPIDSKFNWENFEKMVNSEDEIAKENHRGQFISDVKKKIDEISSKYILPSEGTVDFALMYVPAEAVYYETVQNIKEVDIADYAKKKKVILVSPNTFYLTLSSIQHWFRDVHITNQTRDIIKRLSRIKIDSQKLGDDFRKLGKHISDAHSAYDSSEKRLQLLGDRVENVIEIGGKNKTSSVESSDDGNAKDEEVELSG